MKSSILLAGAMAMAQSAASVPVMFDRLGRSRDTHKLRTTAMIRKANRARNKVARASRKANRA